MKITITLALISLFSFSSAAQTEQVTENEILHLFEFLKASNCEFNRNGKWYNTVEAVEHLNNKYHYLLKRGLISTTEQFIVLAASKSSMSGKAYLVKCGEADPVLCADWFRSEIIRCRSKSRE